MAEFKVYFYKQTESIFLLRDRIKDSANDLIGVKQINSLHGSSSDPITIVDSEKCMNSLNKDIDNDPQIINSQKNINNETEHLAAGNYPIDPKGINNLPSYTPDTYQYIADLKKQLELALRNNEELKEQLDREKAEKEKEKFERLRLEEALRVEKEAKEAESKLRKKIEEAFKLQAVITEEKCKVHEEALKVNENKFKNEVALVKKECEVIDKENKTCQLQLKDVYMELGILKKTVGESERKMNDMGLEMEILKGIKDGFKSRVEQYKKERDDDLGKLNESLYKLKEMTKPMFERFRGRPTKTHQMIDQCIIEVKNRIGCFP